MLIGGQFVWLLALAELARAPARLRSGARLSKKGPDRVALCDLQKLLWRLFSCYCALLYLVHRGRTLARYRSSWTF